MGSRAMMLNPFNLYRIIHDVKREGGGGVRS
jgi:hypothetical protein